MLIIRVRFGIVIKVSRKLIFQVIHTIITLLLKHQIPVDLTIIHSISFQEINEI